MYVTTIDVKGLTPEEYRALLDEMGVETHPASSIYLHITTTIDGGFRIIEIWDSKESFEDFMQKRLIPANKRLSINRQTTISVTALHNFFGPRLDELPGIVPSLPGAPQALRS